ncbi:AraC family transcriptional regulator [Streptomyces sp. NRRL WC-3742]|uniref:AraC family transcriptional regulator n=1 Tax=Streptomyces sp. NRRL WC-3742 TaxID=1463934 RepID=UPI00068EED9C|nr:AraC family transcriptional regulator [Streptomyces sp. NRRL WC-3742]
MATVLFSGGDVRDLHDAVAAEFAPHKLRVRRGDGSGGRLVRHWRGEVSVYELGWGADVDVVPGELPDLYSLQVPLTGTGLVTVDGRPLSTRLSIAGPGQHLAMSYDRGCVNHVLLISRQVVDEAVTARRGEPSSAAVRFDPSLDQDGDAMAAWLELARAYVRATGSGLFTRSPLAGRHHERLLVHGLLDLQPHDLVRPSALGAAPAAAPAAVRRAVAFCAEHAHEPIMVADIARAARVSVSSLRQGFRTHLDTTPMAYLRRLRLDRVHHDLLAAARGGTEETVTQIALRWGFTHLGRFSQEYRRAYGRLPSQVRGGASGSSG